MLMHEHQLLNSRRVKECVQNVEDVQKEASNIPEHGMSGERVVSQQTVMSCFSRATVVRAVSRGREEKSSMGDIIC